MSTTAADETYKKGKKGDRQIITCTDDKQARQGRAGRQARQGRAGMCSVEEEKDKCPNKMHSRWMMK
jgi:hypothetical protein